VKLVRPALALAVGTGLLVAGTAGAVTKPKPVCNLVKDDAGDASDSFIASGVYPTNLDAVDIVSADVATNAKKLTTVIRVKKLATSDPTAPGGLHWKFFFNVGDTQIWTQALAPPGSAPSFRYGTIDGTTGTSKSLGDALSGALDTAKNEIRVTISLSDLPDKPKPGSKLTTLAPNAGRYYSAGVSLSDSTDSAEGSKSYTVGAPSCVKVGA
jgi:hypothetical protein